MAFHYGIVKIETALTVDGANYGAGGAKPIAIDSNHFMVVYAGSGVDGYAEVLTVNTTTWVVTTAATRIEFDTQNWSYGTLTQVDANHFVTFYAGEGNDGYAQVLAVNTSTWAVTTTHTKFEFDTVLGMYHSSHKIDDTHVIDFFSGNGSDGFAQVFAIDTTTWAISTAASALEFDTQTGSANSSAQIDSNHFINFYIGNAATTDSKVAVFTVNTSTWAVSTNSVLQFDTDVGNWFNAYPVDANHFLCFWSGEGGDGYVQTFAVNTSTWAVTTAAARLEFEPVLYINTVGGNGAATAKIDTNHFIHSWGGADTGGGSSYDGFAQVFEVNTTTWEVTTSSDAYEHNVTQGFWTSLSELIPDTTNKLLYIGNLTTNNYGYSRVWFVDRKPTVSLSSPADSGSISDTTPDLVFTGTDVDANPVSYQIELDTANTFDSTAKTTALIDNYGVTLSSYPLYTGSNTAVGQAFKNTRQATLKQASFKIYKTNSPTGTVKAEVYSVTATNEDWTVNTLLATSDTINLTSVTGTPTWVDFTFSGVNQITLSANTWYILVFNVTGTTSDSSNIIYIQYMGSSPTIDQVAGHDGNMVYYSSTPAWVVEPIDDLAFRIYGDYNGALVMARSEADAGFSGTPDNTDPFTSGQDVTYTVQSALSSGTYYWRVRGKDPAGMAYWGDWSSTRSFEVTAASTFIPKIVMIG